MKADRDFDTFNKRYRVRKSRDPVDYWSWPSGGVNDADRLGRDPMIHWIVGGRAVAKATGSTRRIGRFETEFLATDENLTDLAGLPG